MTDLVFLFPGQGSQAVGMGADFAALPPAPALFAQADEIVGRPLSRLIFEGPSRELQRSENLQPAMTVVSAVCLAMAAQAGLAPVAVAGHSLGELTAIHAAGVIDFGVLVELADLRGRAMQAAADAAPGRMAAIQGLSRAVLEELIATMSPGSRLCLANHNGPAQFVVSGELSALVELEQRAAAGGATAFRYLEVSGPWHSPAMAPAAVAFAATLAEIELKEPRVPVFCNVDGVPCTDAPAIRDALVRQITSPVRWYDELCRIRRDFPDAAFVEVGPGKVLSGLLLGADRRASVMQIGDRRSLRSCLAKLAR